MSAGFSGGLGDLFDAFFGGNPFGGGPAERGPEPRRRPRGRDRPRFEEAVFGTQAPVTVRTAVACDDCEATGAAPGTSATTCPECGGGGQVRRVRQSLLGQMVTASPCPRCGGLGTVRRAPVPDLSAARAGAPTRSPTPSTCPPASTPARRCASPVGVRSAPAAAASATSTCTSGSDPTSGSCATATTWSTSCTCPMAQAALGAHLAFETLDGTEDLVDPAGHPDRARLPPARPGRPPRRGPGPRRPAGAGGRRHAHRADRRAGADAAGLRRGAGRRGRSGRHGPAVQDPLGLPVAAGARPCPAGPHVFVDDLDPARGRRGRPPPPRARAPVAARRPADGVGRPWLLAGVPVRPRTRAGGRGRPRRRRRAALTVGFALVKGERPELIVQKLTELGIDRIVPFVAERSVVRWDGDRAAGHVERLRRVAREAAMQSRRCWLPEVVGRRRLRRRSLAAGDPVRGRARWPSRDGDPPSVTHDHRPGGTRRAAGPTRSRASWPVGSAWASTSCGSKRPPSPRVP